MLPARGEKPTGASAIVKMAHSSPVELPNHTAADEAAVARAALLLHDVGAVRAQLDAHAVAQAAADEAAAHACGDGRLSQRRAAHRCCVGASVRAAERAGGRRA